MRKAEKRIVLVRTLEFTGIAACIILTIFAAVGQFILKWNIDNQRIKALISAPIFILTVALVTIALASKFKDAEKEDIIYSDDELRDYVADMREEETHIRTRLSLAMAGFVMGIISIVITGIDMIPIFVTPLFMLVMCMTVGDWSLHLLKGQLLLIKLSKKEVIN